MHYKNINTFSSRRLWYSLDPEPLGKLSTELVDGNVSPLRSLPSAPAGAGAGGGGGFGPDARRRDIFFWTSCLNPRMRPTSDTPLVRPPNSPACRITTQFYFYVWVTSPLQEPIQWRLSRYDSFNEHTTVRSWSTDWLISLVSGLTSPDAPRPLLNGPLCPIPTHGSPVALPKFQMAPTLIFLISSGSKKKEPRCMYPSEVRASHSQRMWVDVASLTPHLLCKVTNGK
jgi:hypothetical protein